MVNENPLDRWNQLTIIFCSISVDWYKDRLTDAQLDELENPKPPPTVRVKGVQRRKSNRKPARVEVDEDDE